MFGLTDTLRRAQGEALGAFGFGPAECRYRVLAAGRRWRLRAYAGAAAGPPLLIVPAPIKRPYIWDLAPSVSAVGHCLRRGLRVFLLEWPPPGPGDGDAGLAAHADLAIGEAVARVAREVGGAKPVLMGHSLGGTVAAIHAAAHPKSLAGLVLLATPLCFRPGSSRFRDAIVAMAPPALSGLGEVPGSLLSQLSALASPETFVWSRLADAARSMADPRALEVLARIGRWSLDEVALPGALVHDILEWLYRDDRFCHGRLRISGKTLGPARLRLPTLAVANAADEVAPRASLMPFVEAMPGEDAHVIEFPGETGVGLQHLAVLVGREAHARVWPRIVEWLNAHCQGPRRRA